jgi:SAM-dependent methyltransferase
VPSWTGDGFIVDGVARRILTYGAGVSGWNDHLTDLHEQAAGSDHFIDLASRRHAVAEAKRVTARTTPVILEIGISSGYLIDDLAEHLPFAAIIGADYTYGTLEHASQRLPPGIPLLQFDLVECPLPDACVDVVILLNVLEHIERDDVALAQLRRILKPGGAAIIEVPAGEGLYGSYDKALLHWRRYSMSTLIRRARDAGFDVYQRSHLGFFLYPGFWLAKKLSRRNPAPDRELDNSVEASISWSRRLGSVAAGVMAVEARLRSLVYLPFGIRCLVTLRKAAD